jgi:penicillin-binding protein 1A
MIEMSRAIRKLAAIAGKSLAALLMLCGPALLAWSGWLVWHFEYGLGLPDDSKLAAISGTAQICSAGHGRSFVPLAEIPALLRSAVLAEEEPDFYGRPAILEEFALAALSNRSPRSATIANHLVRCLMPPECCKGLDRPIGTLVLLDRVDKILSKDTIFEIYLNEVYLGRGNYGVADAAASYFGKSLAELKLEEVAFIVGHAKHPSPGKTQESEIRFRNLVIGRMFKAGVISEAED